MELKIRDLNLSNIPAAADVLKNAFREDSLFKLICCDPVKYELKAADVIKPWVKWCILYGKAWSDENIRAVALRKTAKKLKMSYYSMFRAGMFGVKKILGKETFEKYLDIILYIERAREELVGKQPYWYAWAIGTLPEYQGMGLGKLLMEHTFKHTDREKLPIYLETFSESNVEIHSHAGYELVKTIKLPGYDIKGYFMKREPR